MKTDRCHCSENTPPLAAGIFIAGNVTKNGFRFADCQFISEEKDRQLNKGKLTRGDVVLTTRGTLGNFSFFYDEIAFENIRINSGMVILRNTSPTVSNTYLYLVLRSHIVASQIERLAFGSAQPQLTVKGISTFKIPLPPTKAEQEAIAEALSDADAFIESLAQLIAKKRQIKQGAMQELLTGKKRLPGFSGEWKQKEIREVLSLIMDYRGRTPKKLGMEWGGGDIRALSAGNVKMGKIDFSQDAYFGSEELYLRWMTQGETKPNDVLITTEAPLGNVAIIPDSQKYILSQRTILLRPYPKIMDSNFLFHTFVSTHFQNLLIKDSSGSTATGIQRLKFEKINISFPLVSEQTAIASILSDMDAEIDTLEAKLTKARQIKQGMMHNLLTGKIRLA